jgi:cytochrome P450
MNAKAPKPGGPEGIYIDPAKPLNMGDAHFTNNKYEYYRYLREHMPVSKGRISVVKVNMLSRYDDCLALTKDPRFGRDKSTITGGSRMPFPVPKSVELIALSMIMEDDPKHRRLRNLVQKAFSPKALASMEGRIEGITHQLMDEALAVGQVNLQQQYALQIPVTVIGEMVGVTAEEMPQLQKSLRVLTNGLSGWNIFRTIAWDLRQASKYMRSLIVKKRQNPADDILTALIEAEEEGDRLTEDEIVSMLFLLIIAGYETTVHLITNGVQALLTHPDELARLRQHPEHMGSAVEEILRFCGPVHGTKMNYAKEDVEIAGVVIPKGEAVIPLLGSANHDAKVFDDPETFNITRDPNRHLSFSQGNHFCLGAFLARMETKIALRTLLERSPNLRLAVPPEDLKMQSLPFWHRHDGLPVYVD